MARRPDGSGDSAPLLWRNTAFRRLFAGQALSGLGSSAASIAYPLLVLALTHSAAVAGAVGTIGAGVAMVLRLPAGALTDRLDRRLTLIACDSARLVVLLVLGVLVLTGDATWPVIAAVAVVEDAGGVLFSPASTAVLPAIVPAEQLESAWAVGEANMYGTGLAGPAVGGVLFALGRAVPFLADAASYAVSVASIGAIRGHFRPERRGPRRSLLHETLEGVRVVARTPLLRAVAVQAPLTNFAFTGALFTITLALRRHGDSSTLIGLVQGAVAGGGLLGALLAPRLQGRWRLSRLVLTLTAGGAAMFALAALLVPSAIVGVPAALALFLSPAVNASLVAVMLRTTPDELRGRVNNTVITAATGLAALAPLVAGIFVQRVSGTAAMAFFASVLAVASVLVAFSDGLRSADAGPNGGNSRRRERPPSANDAAGPTPASS
jgi:MFS family permease